jgi:hypothetical protein
LSGGKGRGGEGGRGAWVKKCFLTLRQTALLSAEGKNIVHTIRCCKILRADLDFPQIPSKYDFFIAFLAVTKSRFFGGGYAFWAFYSHFGWFFCKTFWKIPTFLHLVREFYQEGGWLDK